MSPRDDNGDDGLDGAFKVFNRKMDIEERITIVHQQLLYLRRDMVDMKKTVVYKDTDEANRKAINDKICRNEVRIDKLEQQNIEAPRFGLTTGIAVISIIVAALAVIAAVVIH